jgi:hypothetical protein
MHEVMSFEKMYVSLAISRASVISYAMANYQDGPYKIFIFYGRLYYLYKVLSYLF